MQVPRSSRLWTRAASLEIGELPLESGAAVIDLSVSFSAAGSLSATATVVAVLAASMSGAGFLDATLTGDGVVHDLAVSFSAAGQLAATPTRLEVLSATMSGAGSLSATLEGGSPVQAAVTVLRARLDRRGGPSFRVGT